MSSGFVGRATVVAIALAAHGGQLRAQASASVCSVARVADTARAVRDTGSATLVDSAARTATDSAARAARDRPSIVLYASASAREVRFAAQPRIVVRLCGAIADSVHVIERRNLPERVQPGVTYRDVFIAVEILGHLNAECLAQRIGEGPGPASVTDCASIGIRDSSAAAPVRRPPP